MGDRLGDLILRNAGLDPADFGSVPAPDYVPRELSAVAKARQAALVETLRDAHASLGILIAMVEVNPDRDDFFDQFDMDLGRHLNSAADALIRFRDIRECEGEG